jgi:hypothetical protein
MDTEKMTGLAFAAHELSTIVPMVHENPELAGKLIMAKDFLGVKSMTIWKEPLNWRGNSY